MGIELVIGEPGDSEVFVVGDPSSEIVVGEETTQVIEVHPTEISPPGPQGLVGPKGDPGGWVQAITIANDVDLDTLKTAGLYFRNTSVGSTTALNYPMNAWAGYVEVINFGTTYVLQRATAIASTVGTAATSQNVWVRVLFGAAWQPWYRVDIADHVKEADPHPQYVRKATVNTFTGTQTFSGNGNQVMLSRTNAPEGLKNWWMYVETDGSLRLLPKGDDGTTTNGRGIIVGRDGSIIIGDIKVLSGTGSPLGVVSASPGSKYTDINCTNGAVEWVKIAGAGTSGWEVTYGDTGWRDISDSLNASWVKSTVAPSCRIRRVGSRVTFEARLNPAPSLVGNSRSGGNALLTIPLRFNPISYVPQGNVLLNSRAFGLVSTIGSTTQLQINPDMTLSGNWTATDLLSISATWEVNQAWPTTLPGTPV